MIRIAVLVSGGGTNLQALLDASAAGKIPHGEFCLVLSNKADAYALTRAERAGIPAVTCVREKGMPRAEYEKQVLDILAEYDIDLIVLAGFLAILSADFISHYEDRIINIHPSLIPSFCGKGFYGLKVHEAALDYGVKVTGATVHFVNAIPDGGRILLQKAVPVKPDDTPETLQLRVMQDAEWQLLPQATEMVCASLEKEMHPYE